jgi:hypothetical protein
VLLGAWPLVVILGSGLVTGDLVGDLVEVLNSLCARSYGCGWARDRAFNAVAACSGMSGRTIFVGASGQDVVHG